MKFKKGVTYLFTVKANSELKRKYKFLGTRNVSELKYKFKLCLKNTTDYCLFSDQTLSYNYIKELS